MLKTEFPGSSIVFDAVSEFYLKLSNLQHPLANSRLEFALSPEAADIPGWDPEMSIRNYIGFGDSPWYDGRDASIRVVEAICGAPVATRQTCIHGCSDRVFKLIGTAMWVLCLFLGSCVDDRTDDRRSVSSAS